MFIFEKCIHIYKYILFCWPNCIPVGTCPPETCVPLQGLLMMKTFLFSLLSLTLFSPFFLPLTFSVLAVKYNLKIIHMFILKLKIIQFEWKDKLKDEIGNNRKTFVHVNQGRSWEVLTIIWLDVDESQLTIWMFTNIIKLKSFCYCLWH